MTMIDKIAERIADIRGVRQCDRTDGMMAVFRMDAKACISALHHPSQEMYNAVEEMLERQNAYMDCAADDVWGAMLSGVDK